MESPTDRQERISWWRQAVLREARVAVIGAGALGNEVIKNLSLMGIGALHVFDRDRIEQTNLSRSVLFEASDEGQSKAAVAAARAARMNVYVDAVSEAHDLDVVWELGGSVIRRMSLVLGCLDNVEARIEIGRHCYQLGVPYIDGGISELSGRVQLHYTGQGACMECSMSSWELKQARQRYSCLQVMKDAHEAGAVPTVQICSAFVASMMCQEAIKHLHGKHVKWGRLISWFGETNDFDTLEMPRRDGCQTCSSQPPILIEVSCGSASSMHDLLEELDESAMVHLPATFIESATCSKCEMTQELNRAAWRCREKDLACPKCGSLAHIDMRGTDVVSADTPHQIRKRTLSDLGIADEGTVMVTTPAGVVLVALGR